MNDTHQTILVGSLLERRVSMFSHCKAARPQEEIRLGSFLQKVRNGQWATEVGRVRAAAQNDKKDADELKARLPVLKPSGTFKGLRADDLHEHSGILCIDFDEVGKGASKLRAALAADPYVLAVAQSPSGTGLKVFVPVAATGRDDHKQCFKAAAHHFNALMPAGGELDTKPSNVASNCFVTWDPKVWIASTPRRVFMPEEGAGGCDRDISHVIESNEKEFSTPLSSLSPSRTKEEPISSVAPRVVRLRQFIDADVWPNWVKREKYRTSERNGAICRRVPILINIVEEHTAALLMLRWFDEAPDGLFKDSRNQHWEETRCLINSCIESWPDQERISLREKQAYIALKNARQRATFRILRSLSLCKTNAASGVFFIPTGNLADRLDCGSEPASRQIQYMIRDGIIEIAETAIPWAPNMKSRAARYRWKLR